MIEIDAESKKWIKAKGGQVTVKTVNINVCCAPGVQELVALPGKPKNLNHYNEVKVDHFLIYLHKNICHKEKLTLTLSGFSFLKTISAQIQ